MYTSGRMTPAVGADIESLCSKCGDVWHVVVAKVGEEIVRVICKECGGQHRYRNPKAPAGAKRAETTTKSPRPVRPMKIVERFEHPVVVSALCCLLGAAGPITGEATGVYFALLGFIQRFGLGRAVGGMQTLPDALASRLAELGGDARVNAPVAEIVAKGGRVQGLRLVDGSVIAARSVIAAVHPSVALKMVTPGAIERRLLVRAELAPSNAHGGAPVKVDVALRGQVRATRHEAQRPDGLSLRQSVLLIGTAEAVLDNFKCAARGEVSKQPYLWATAPSAVDPTQAPEGQDIAYLYPVAMPVAPREGWDAIRAQVTQQVIDQARLEQCTIQPVPSLHMQFIDAACTQIAQQGGQIDPAVGAWQLHHGGPTRLECRLAG